VRLLDLFIATLIVFPWLAEGFWGETPWGFFEPADWAVPLLAAGLVVLAVRRDWRAAAALAALAAAFLAGALGPLSQRPLSVLVVALVAVAVRRSTQEPWERSFFVRLGKRIARFWLDALERSPRRTLWIAAGAVGTVLFAVALARHRGFATHGTDLGHFTNAMWNLTNGHGYVSSIKNGANVFTDHQSPTFWLLAPLFWLVPRPETLLFAQSFGLAAGGPALYYLGRARFQSGHWVNTALPWLYWCYLPLRNANAWDFHPEVLMLPLFLWAFVGFASGRRWAKALGFAALIAALGAKESAPVVAVGIGIAWALTGGRWKGVALAVAGVALFFFDVKVVPRLFGAEDYAYMGHYQRFGGGIGDLLLAPFTQPAYFFSQIINAERLKFLFWTLAPLGFLPLFHWRVAFAAVPVYLMFFLTAGDQRVDIQFYYGVEPGAALFLALPFGLAAFSRRFGWTCAGVWMLCWAVAAFGPGELARPRLYQPAQNARWMANEVIPCLDPQAPMAATDRLMAHLATRHWIAYPDKLQGPAGAPVSCVVTDRELGGNWPLGRGGLERVLAGLPGRGYREAWRCGNLSVHELEGKTCLRCAPSCP
jgi:uncharacterized membrane protein